MIVKGKKFKIVPFLTERKEVLPLMLTVILSMCFGKWGTGGYQQQISCPNSIWFSIKNIVSWNSKALYQSAMVDIGLFIAKYQRKGFVEFYLGVVMRVRVFIIMQKGIKQ